MDHICEDVVRLRSQTTGVYWDKNGEFSWFVQPEKFPGLRRHICFLVFGRLGQQCGVRESLDDIQTLLVFVVQYAHLEK